MDEADKPARRGHFRGSARRGKAVELEYRASGGAPVAATTLNIGIGGAFIATASPLPVGNELQVIIRIPGTTEALAIDARVRWTKAGADHGDQAGMGVEFYDLEPDAVVRLTDYFASLVAADAADTEL